MMGPCLLSFALSVQAPLLRDQRAEYERISAENNALAAQLARTLEERDSEAAKAEGYRLDAVSLKSENDLLAQQTRDLGRQVRSLLREIASRDDPAIADRSAGQPDEDDEVPTGGEETLDSIISSNFVTFRTLSQLQEQNQHLLRATRELGQKLDRAESDVRQKVGAEENLAVTEAHELILQLKNELERTRAQLESMSRERDMLRRLAGGRGGSSVGQDRPGSNDARALSELKADFDAYRNETSADSQKLKDDLLQARRDANAAEVAAAKSNAQTEYLNGNVDISYWADFFFVDDVLGLGRAIQTSFRYKPTSSTRNRRDGEAYGSATREPCQARPRCPFRASYVPSPASFRAQKKLTGWTRSGHGASHSASWGQRPVDA
jgi:nucleoprotein TPR